MREIFDAAVIGSGGGSIIADTAIETGHKVAMIEATGWGGTCLNRGCIPTKIMVHAADLIRASQRAAEVALKGAPLEVDWPALKSRVFSKIAEGESMPEYYAPYENIRLFRAFASFAGTEETAEGVLFRLKLEGKDGPAEILARRVVLANGGRTKIPRGIGLENVPFLSSESLFNPDTWPAKLPESMLIIGGGDIGVEFAHIFSAFGVKTDLVQHNVRLVPKHDHAISEGIRKVLTRDGIRIHLNYDTTAVWEEKGRKILEIRERSTGEVSVLEAEALFVCPGIVPNTDGLNLEAAGLRPNERGWIETNEYLETAVPGIYALGDINGRQQLRHKSNYEAQILAHNLFVAAGDPEGRRRADYEMVPAGTFTAMQIGTIGLSEHKAKAQGLSYRVGFLPFSATAQGYAHGILPGDEADGFAKMILSEDGKKILGVHVMAPEASSLAQAYVYLMSAAREEGLAPDNPEIVKRAMTIHPSLAELPAWALGNRIEPEA